MASLASVATLGSARSNSSVCDGFPVTIRRTSVFKGSSFIHFAPRWSKDYPLGSARSYSFVCDGSPVTIRRTFVFRGSSFIHFAPRWSKDYPWVCKCSTVTTELIAELGNSVPPVSTFRGSKDDDSDLILKPSPKPILKAPPKPEPILTVNSRNSVPWAPTKPGRDPLDRKPEKVEDRERVIESLGEVLEKAEKLENATPTNIDIMESSISAKPTLSADASPTEGKPSILATPRKSKTLKSVWRKGNPVSSMQKVVKGASNSGRESIKIQEPEKSKVPPQAPLKPQPKLQAKPAAAIPPVIKKPVILKDVGATPRPPVSEVSEPSMKVKDRKPILIDKFAPKKPADDPLINQVVLPPVKPPKGSSQQKLKDEKRKKAGATGGLRRRLKNEDVVPDDETSELNVSIPGAEARKGRKWSKASRKAARLEAAKAAAPVKAEILEVGVEGMMTEDLAYNLAISEVDILGFLYSKGLRPDTVFALDKDIVKMVCNEYDVEVMETDPVKVEDMAKKKKVLDEEDLDVLEERPPVLTIMGHVDHGKTTLLDYIRKSRVAASEAGGITQGIGAYKVLVPADGKLQPCVFLDTPGHEAFGAMRARGARVTDIAIIVVAADDGVRPQTKEAIAHAKAAQVPIVVAINKIDKEGASPERVMKELSDAGLMPEDWGGDVPMVQISALKGEKVDDLLETVMLHAEFQELKANPKRSAKGTVIEAGLDKSRGPVATFIVQNGTLKKGDVVVCGEAFGKVRALFDDRGAQVDDAGPSTAVQIIGLNNVPIAGDEFEVVGSLDTAREKAETRAEQLRAERISAKAGEGKVTLSSIATAVSAGKQSGLDMHQLNIILKVDVQGSIEAIRQAIQMLPQDNVTLKFLMQAPGDVSTSDVDLAVAAEAIIFGFNIKVPGSVKKYADNKGIEIRNYRVIYELIDDMRKAMEGLLEPVEEKVPIGRAEVRAIFTSGSGRVAGCMVTEGKVVKGCGLQVVRNGKTVYTGILESLRRVKEMVKEVAVGLECGIGVEDYDDWEEGDIIETFDTVKKQRTLEEASASVAAALAKAGVGR